MAQPQTPYIGSKISLISKLDIRYEGILYTVDSKESTIALSKVRSFGTEDRSTAHHVPPQEEVYDYIIFKANDIKDLIVCEMPKPAAPGLPYDPAILSVSEKPAESPMSTPQASNDQKAANLNTPIKSRNNDNKQPQRFNQQNQNGNRFYNNRNYNNRNNDQRNYRNDYRDGRNRNDYRDGNRNYNNSRGGNYNNQRNRGRTNRPPTKPLKFESEFDFEKANKQFQETLDSVVKAVEASKIDAEDTDDKSSSSEVYYDKEKSFFDNISCEAREKLEDKNTRPDWRKERLTNQETFGQQSVRSYAYHRRGNRGNYRRNNYNR